MESGVVRSRRADYQFFLPNGSSLSSSFINRAAISEAGGTVLSEPNLWKDFFSSEGNPSRADHCRSCRKVIINYPE